MSATATALDGVSLNVETLESREWKLNGIQIALTDLSSTPQKLTLSIKQLSLPLPFNDLNLFNIHCSSFTWQNKELLCTHGRAQVCSKQWQSPTANFSFHISEKQSTLSLTDLQLADGAVSIDAKEQDNHWQIQINAKAINSVSLQKLLRPALVELKGGRINFKLTASGSQELIENFSLTTELHGLTGQTKDGRFATEAVTLDTKLDAQNNKGSWQWQSHSNFKGGALYIEPLYLEADRQSIVMDAQGNWSDLLNRAEITSVSYNQAKALAITGNAIVKFDKGITLEKADLSLHSEDLQKLSASYLKPFFELTALEGISFAGTINGDFSI
ncbi:MAG: C4-dicarboxylate ABC transporter, partial [Methylococcaceae bacterium]